MRVPGSWLFYLVLFWAALFAICGSTAKAAPKTNINEITSLFDDHIQGKDRLLNDLKGQMDSAVSGVKSKSGFEMIEGMSGAENKAAELSRIRATDLDNEGRRKRVSEEYRFYDDNELEPDYTKPGNRLHKQDADDIARATGDVLGDLIAKLKDLNIDCKTIKGPVQKEPVYYIDIRRENQRNTEYDQFFCQEPRNKYRCRDELGLTCTKRGVRWHNLQEKELKISGDQLWAEARHLFWTDHVAKKHFEYKIMKLPRETPEGRRFIRYMRYLGQSSREDGPYYIEQKNKIKAYISQKTGCSIDNIAEIKETGWRLHFRHAGGKDHLWNEYYFIYQYRDSYQVCEEWKEDWTERCILQ